MQKDQAKRYADSLERTIQNDHQYLKKTVEDFREMCLRVTPEKNVPQGIINDIREIYKEIQTRLVEIKAIQQLLMGKYREYARRDPLRDKEVKELAFIAKNCLSKFEYTLMQRQAQGRAKIAEKERAIRMGHPKGLFYHWFQSSEKQVHLMRTLRILNELDYQAPSHLGIEERREVTPDRPRSLTFFVLTAEERLLDDFQSQIQLREHDAIERQGANQLRGVITHLREMSDSDMEETFRGLLARHGYSKLKCLLIPVRSLKSLEADFTAPVEKALQEMTEGEIRKLSI